MTSSYYVAYSALRSDMRALDVAANNIANLNTNGYREQRAFVTALEAAGRSYPLVGGTKENRRPGPEIRTDRPLDVAIEGEGFLVVQTPAGRRYTRDGGLSLDADGVLVNRAGLPVLGQGGQIRVPAGGKVDIDPEGRVTVRSPGLAPGARGTDVGRLLLVALPEEAAIREEGGLYRSLLETETPDQNGRLKQGFVESSNVNLPTGKVNQLMRHFQSLSRAMQIVNGLERRLITTVRGQ